MTLNQGHRRLVVPLVCTATIFFGCHRAERAQQSASPADAKAEIHKFLAKKSGQKEFAPGIDLELPKQVATLRSNANILAQRTITLRTSLRAVDEEQTPLRKEIESLRSELANVKREVGETRTRLKEAESRVPADANEIAARQKEHAARDAAWTAKRQELSGKDAQWEAQLGERKQKRAAMDKELQEAERAWEVARVEANRKQEELSRQENAYIGAVRQQIAGVRSYEALYRLIGEQLATADRLLADPDISQRRVGLSFAREACGHANSDPEDVWLAARICEAYLWPNLDLADSKPGSRERALDLLETCRRVFFVSNETNNVLKNYKLLMANAPDARTADTFRVQLADWLEERGDVKRAAEILNEIRDAQVLSSAEERITRVKERIAATP
jgi:flagellar biosynthesis GTPase FlhF